MAETVTIGDLAPQGDDAAADELPLEELHASRRQRRPYSVEEHAVVPIPLSELLVDGKLELYPAVTGRGYFRIGLAKEHLEFQAGGWIGVIPINDRVTIDVRPRVPVRNLERLIAISEHRPFSLAPHLRRYTPADIEVPALLDLLAEGLVDAIRDIEANGLYREYQRVTEDTAFPRGRILLSDTIKHHRSRGIQHRVRTSRFEPAVDTAPNRCLKYALWYLSRRFRELQPRKGRSRLLSDLNQTYHLFDAVKLDHSQSFLIEPLVVNPDTFPAIRAYYRDALQIALTIVENRSVMLRDEGSEIQMASWVVSMEKIFEAYLRIVLRERLKDLAPTIRVLDGNDDPPMGGSKSLFDEGATTQATPDIVIRQTHEEFASTQYPLIVEVKYKKVMTPERDDIEQAIVYAASYRAPIAVIAIPQRGGAAHGLTLVGKIQEISLYQYAIDLAAADPAQEEEAFAQAMRRFVGDPIGSQLHRTSSKRDE